MYLLSNTVWCFVSCCIQPGNAIALPHAIYGSGIGVIWFDDLDCLGNEMSLLDCSHRGVGVNNCGHTEDANVLCPGNECVWKRLTSLAKWLSGMAAAV